MNVPFGGVGVVCLGRGGEGMGVGDGWRDGAGERGNDLRVVVC